MAATLLIADDDNTIRTVLGRALTRSGFKVRTTAHASTLWHWASSGEGDLIITDVAMPDGDGLELVPSLRRIRPELRIIVISAQNSLSTSVKAKEAGVFAYLPKPFDLKELTGLVNAALAEPEDTVRTARLDELAPNARNDFPLIGQSKSMKTLFRVLGKLVTDDSPALLIGEDGTGKSLAAQTLHDFGSKAGQKIRVLSASNIEAYLVGNKEQAPGSQTKESQTKATTLVINSVEALSSHQQSLLLDLLDANKRESDLQHRIIGCATPQVLARLKDETFRRDLYDQLAVVQLQIPALRERSEDIPDLVEHFQNSYDSRLVFSPAAIEFLKTCVWPGNVRQLENLVWRLSLFASQGQVSVEEIEIALDEQQVEDITSIQIGEGEVDRVVEIWLSQHLSEEQIADGKGELYDRILTSIEKPLITQVLAMCGNNQLKTADVLGLNRNTLRKKIKDLDILVGKKGRKQR